MKKSLSSIIVLALSVGILSAQSTQNLSHATKPDVLEKSFADALRAALDQCSVDFLMQTAPDDKTRAGDKSDRKLSMLPFDCG